MRATTWIAALACGLFAAAPARAEQAEPIEGGSIDGDAAVPLIAGRIEEGARLVAAPVASLRYDPLGRFTGYILEDGTSVALIPEEAKRHAWGFARPGEPVLVEYREDRVLRMVNHATGRTLDFGAVTVEPLWAIERERGRTSAPTGAVGGGPSVEPERTPVQGLDELRPLRATGEVASVIRSAEGEPLGVRLQGGTQVFLLPRVAAVLEDVRPGERLQITGKGTRGDHGASLWAGKITRIDETGAPQRVVLDLARGDGAPDLGIAPAAGERAAEPAGGIEE